MANIIRRNEPTSSLNILERDPFSMVRDLMRWDPFRQMAPFITSGRERLEFMPAFEVRETKDAYIIRGDLPGVKDSDIDITLTNNRLAITGKREEEQVEESDQYYAYERSYGTFTRSFTLPEGIDDSNIRSELKGGVLTLAIPKRPEVMPKHITVSGESQQAPGQLGQQAGQQESQPRGSGSKKSSP